MKVETIKMLQEQGFDGISIQQMASAYEDIQQKREKVKQKLDLDVSALLHKVNTTNFATADEYFQLDKEREKLFKNFEQDLDKLTKTLNARLKEIVAEAKRVPKT